jgi:NAD(P)-dependent dehydrogenase (short-subunit alcohol dehydrogenase family)
MELRDRICLVTGGASGIGQALCQRFAAEGARAIVVVDRDADGALATAGALGRRATALTADVTVEADIDAVIDRTEAEIGPIDLFASNAGVLGYGGLESSDDTWSLVWSVNVLAHLYAARAMVPRMLERGGGYLLSTASAAGLLTQPGDAPYSVTKHAAVALAEWLAVTYGDQGIKVSCVCPMAVDTAMFRGGEAASDKATGPVSAPAGITGVAGAAAVQGVLSPEQVAHAVVEGVREERFLILPHPEVATFEQRRAADRDRWLAGMRRLAASFTGSAGNGTDSDRRAADEGPAANDGLAGGQGAAAGRGEPTVGTEPGRDRPDSDELGRDRPDSDELGGGERPTPG